MRVGAVIQTAGAAISALASNGTPISRDLFNRAISNAIGGKLGEYPKSILDKALSKVEDIAGPQAAGNRRPRGG